MAKRMDTQILKKNQLVASSVMLNLFQHLSIDETLKQVQGDHDQVSI